MFEIFDKSFIIIVHFLCDQLKILCLFCSVEITVSNGISDKNSEDNSSDDAADFKFDPANNFAKFLSKNSGKLFESSPKMDPKSPSVSLIPLHNSVSYCFPGAANPQAFQGMYYWDKLINLLSWVF